MSERVRLRRMMLDELERLISRFFNVAPAPRPMIVLLEPMVTLVEVSEALSSAAPAGQKNDPVASKATGVVGLHAT